MNDRSLLYRLGVLHHSIRYYQQPGVSPEVNDQLLQATTQNAVRCAQRIEIKMAKLKRENDRGQP